MRGAVLNPMDFEDETAETFGLAKLSDLTMKNNMDLLSCVECGRCTQVCPANLAGKNLDPKTFITKARDLSFAGGDDIWENPIYQANEIDACTTCGACMEECPANIEHVNIIMEAKRYKALTLGEIPPAAADAVNKIRNNGNPWGITQEDRFKWAEGKNFKENLTLWKMSPNRKRKQEVFNVLDKYSFEKANVYYDKSCDRKKCHGDIVESIKNVFSNFAAKEAFTLFIIKDHTYASAIKKKNIKKARAILSKLEELYFYFNTKFKKNASPLILVTSSAVRNIEFPHGGRDWKNFENRGKKVLFKRNSLMSYSLATGAGAENFCGIYEESEILKRIIWRPEDRKWGI